MPSRGSLMSGLRMRLILLVLGVSILPTLGLFYFTLAERRTASQRVDETAQRAVSNLADEFGQSLSQAHLVLVSLERAVQAVRGEPPTCNEIYTGIRARYEQLAPAFTNIGAISPQGEIYCAVNIIGGPVDVSGAIYFQRALTTHNFTVGDVQYEAGTGRTLLPVSYPLQGYTAIPRAVVFAFANLDWLDLLYARSQTPTGTEFMLVDSDHHVLVSYPRSVVASAGLDELALQTGASVTIAQRLYAATALENAPIPGLWAVVSIPTTAVYGAANRALSLNLLFLGGVVVLVLAAASWGGEFFVLRDMRTVLQVTERVGRGELSARTGIKSGTHEVNQLARAFDHMSAALEQREHERLAAEAETQQLLVETQRRASELAALYEITHDIATQQNLTALLQRIVERAAHLLAASGSVLFLFDEARGDLELTASYGNSAMPAGLRVVLGQETVGAVAQMHQARILLPGDINFHPPEVNANLSSIALVPLLYGGRLIGVLGVGADRTQQPYTEANVRLLALVAGHIASAVYNARLLEAETVARQTAETLRAANMALTRLLDLDVVLETLLDYLGQLVPYDTANIMLLETETRLSIRAMRGYANWTSQPPLRDTPYDVAQLPLDQRVLTQQTSVLVGDTLSDPEWRELVGGQHVRNWLGVPLAAGGRTLGLFSLDKNQPHFFTSAHQRLAEAMAAQAAVAIQNARLYSEVQQGQERLRQLAQQIVTAQEDERQRVSRELHDEAGQALVGLKLNLELMRDNLPSEARSFVRHIEITERQIDHAVQRIRALARNLRPQALETVGLHRMLEDMCLDYAERTHLHVDYRGVELADASGDLNISLYRVAQEALTNVARHAHAQKVRVELGRENGAISLLVEDDGQGFDWVAAQQPRAGGGIGLIGMRERVQLLGGAFDVISEPGRGTLLVARIPWQSPAPPGE